MLNYSVAIRTLGLNHELLRRELESVFAQTVKPDKVVLYIAEGYALPPFRVGDEQYVAVPKGMVAQRALDYHEIDSELLLLLDDDVTLEPDTVERMAKALADNNLDCIAADTFADHRMSAAGKLYSFITNLSLPLPWGRYAYRIHGNGSLSYLNNPRRDVYLSQAASGPCSLWRRESLLWLDLRDELWLDTLDFAYGDDHLEFYKLYANGGRLGMHFNSGAVHLDARTGRDAYTRGQRMFYTRAKAQYIAWHRSLYACARGRLRRWGRALSMGVKLAWLLPVHLAACVRYRSFGVLSAFVSGTLSGMAFCRSKQYRSLPPYIKKNHRRHP